MPRKEHWACHISQKGFTGGIIASSYAESTGSAEGAWFQKPRNTLIEVFTTCFEKEQFEIKKEETLLAQVLMKSTHGVRSDPPFAAQCRAMYSGYLTDLLLAELSDAANYTAFIKVGSLELGCGRDNTSTRIPITVKRNIVTEKERTVVVFIDLPGKKMISVNSCDCPTVANCGYPCKHIFCASVLCSTQFSTHIRFEHLKHFFNDRYLLKRNVEFLGKIVEGDVMNGPVLEGHESTRNDTAFDADEDCKAEHSDVNDAHFGTQIQPPQQAKGKRIGHVSFEKLRTEVTPLCQAGSRNSHVGSSLMEIFKAMHTAVLAMTPDEQKMCTANSLVFACQRHLSTVGEENVMSTTVQQRGQQRGLQT